LESPSIPFRMVFSAWSFLIVLHPGRSIIRPQQVGLLPS
jgi:hypothetical protein